MIDNRRGVSLIFGGFHRQAKLFELNFFIIQTFHQMVKPASKPSSQPVNLPVAWFLMKPLACNRFQSQHSSLNFDIDMIDIILFIR